MTVAETGPALAGVAAVLRLFDQRYLHEHVLLQHDQAREAYRVDALTVADNRAFNLAVAAYVQHHELSTSGLTLTYEVARGLGIRLLRDEFPSTGYADGYEAALAAGVGLRSGGVPDVVNALLRGFKARALQTHIDAVFVEQVETLSGSSRRELARTLCERYGMAFGRLGVFLDETVIAADPLKALLSIRTVLGRVLSELEVAWH